MNKYCDTLKNKGSIDLNWLIAVKQAEIELSFRVIHGNPQPERHPSPTYTYRGWVMNA